MNPPLPFAAPTKDTRPLGSDEALLLLFDDARVLSISQKTYGPTSLIARLEHCRVGATIEPGIVHLCVSAHSAEVARNVARAFGDPVLDTTATGLGPGGTGRVGQGEDRGRIEADQRLCATVVEVDRNYPGKTRSRRPDQVALISERRVSRRTPGRIRTRVLTDVVCV